MVIVVPAVTHRQVAEHHVVPAPLTGVEPLRPEEVADRVHREGNLKDEYHAQAVAEDEPAPAADRETNRRQEQTGHHPQAVQPDQFRVLHQVVNHGLVWVQ